MDLRHGNLTVSALVGTGAATLGFALFGIAGVGGQVRAADSARTVAQPAVAAQDVEATLRDEARSPKWDGHSPLATPCPTPVPTTPASGEDELAPPSSESSATSDREI